MSDFIYHWEKNLGIILVPIGVIGLVCTFGWLFNLAQTKNGVSLSQTWTVGAFFLLSLLLTALGSQVKVTSSLSGGFNDGEEE